MCIPCTLNYITKLKFYLDDFRTKNKLNNLLNVTKSRILIIEIQNLYRQFHKLNRELITLTRKIADSLPVYIWDELFDRNM